MSLALYSESMASTSINSGRLPADKSGAHKFILTARPDMRIVKASVIPPVLVVGVGVILYSLRLPIDHDIQLGASAFLGGIGLVGILCVAVLYEGLSRAEYRVTSDHIEEEYGIIYKKRRQIPLGYGRDVTCTQNVAQSLFGLSSITVSPTNGDRIVFSNVRDLEQTGEAIWKVVLSKSSGRFPAVNLAATPK